MQRPTAELERSGPSTKTRAAEKGGMAYTLGGFLQDYRRLVPKPAAPKDLPVSDELLDGRWVLLRREHLSRMDPDEARLSEFRAVLERLMNSRASLVWAGLADFGNTIAVREEFLAYLLSCDLPREPKEIPKEQIQRFLASTAP